MSDRNEETRGPESAWTRLAAAADERILVLDGAMGTMIQRHRLKEEDYRGTRLADWPRDLKGNNELLSLTRPEIIRAIHDAYLAAGADIVETNTFNANAVSQADYGTEGLVAELNLASARLAREAADAATAKTPDKPRFVAGAIGPTNRSASISPDVNRPDFRNISFDELVTVYRQQAEALLEGGIDAFLVETIFDTLNAKAALFALDELFEARGLRLPVMVSGTVTDMSGRNLSGQTVEAFWNSVRHARPFSIGLNCAFGAKELRPYIAELARKADTLLCAYPNAGLPNAMGEYDETPEETAAHLKEWAEAGLLNIVGGCCGTTPDHIAAIARAVAGKAPRKVPILEPRLRLAGLEAFTAAG